MGEEKKLCAFGIKIKTSDDRGRPVYSIRLPCVREDCAVWDEVTKGCSLSVKVGHALVMEVGTRLTELAKTAEKQEVVLGYIGNALRHLLPSEGVEKTVPGRMATALEKIAASLERLAATNDRRLDEERKRSFRGGE